MGKNKKSLQILRGQASGTNANTIEATELLDGQLFYDKSTNTLKIGSNMTDSAGTHLTVGTAKTIEPANNSISSIKIQAGAVTSTELAASAVTSTNIADDAITTDKIKDKAVTSDKLYINPLSSHVGTFNDYNYINYISIGIDGSLTGTTMGEATSTHMGLVKAEGNDKLDLFTLDSTNKTITLNSDYKLGATLTDDSTVTTVSNADVTNLNSGANAIVNFQIGSGTAYKKTINNVAKATNATYATYADKLNVTEALGAENQYIWVDSGGNIIVSTSNIGAQTQSTSDGNGTFKPVYASEGIWAGASTTIGSSTKPIYMNAGVLTKCSGSLDVDITGNANSATTATSIIHTSSDGNTYTTTINTSESAVEEATPFYILGAFDPCEPGRSLSCTLYPTTSFTAPEAAKLTTNAGSSNVPVYFSGGKPEKCGSLSVVYTSLTRDEGSGMYASDKLLSKGSTPTFKYGDFTSNIQVNDYFSFYYRYISTNALYYCVGQITGISAGASDSTVDVTIITTPLYIKNTKNVGDSSTPIYLNDAGSFAPCTKSIKSLYVHNIKLSAYPNQTNQTEDISSSSTYKWPIIAYFSIVSTSSDEVKGKAEKIVDTIYNATSADGSKLNTLLANSLNTTSGNAGVASGYVYSSGYQSVIGYSVGDTSTTIPLVYINYATNISSDTPGIEYTNPIYRGNEGKTYGALFIYEIIDCVVALQ